MTIEEKAELVKDLYNNKAFTTLILDDFINQGILDHALNENVDSEAVRDQLKARKILLNYLYDIINQAEIISQEGKER